MRLKKIFPQGNPPDILIFFGVQAQALLTVVQHCIMQIWDVPNADATTFRVTGTIICLLPAIFISYKRDSLLWIKTYSIVLIILFFQTLLFPGNMPFLKEDSTRFLLPIVIPSALCLMTTNNIELFDDVLYKISWLTSFFVVLYVMSVLGGKSIIGGYNMSFGYAALIPAITLYSRKRPAPIFASIVILLAILIVGSRGPVLMMALFVIFDLLKNSKRSVVYILLIGIALLVLLPHLGDILSAHGVSSRSLSYYEDGTIMDDSGRGSMTRTIKRVIYENPIFGVGLWGDRYYLGGMYAHNIIYEMVMDWGIPLGSIVLVILLKHCISVYRKCDTSHKVLFVRYLCTYFIYLFVSGSYLTSYNFGIFVGILFLFNNYFKKKYDNGRYHYQCR